MTVVVEAAVVRIVLADARDVPLASTATDVLVDVEAAVAEDAQVAEAAVEAVLDVVHAQDVLDVEVHVETIVEVHVLQTAILLVEILAQEIAEMTAREDVLTRVKVDVDLLA